MKKLTTVAAIVVTALAGCATYRPDPMKQAIAQSTIPVCMSERECELKWAAARRWVLNNASFKIKTISNDFIETHGPIGGSPLVAVRVNKDPIPTGGYRIVVGVYCDNMFGCAPDAWDSAIRFNNEVNSPADF